MDPQPLEMVPNNNQKRKYPMNCSVIILNWNGTKLLRRYLPSVVANTPEAEIVLVDNGSSDNSIDVTRTEFPTVRILPLKRNYGFAEGYNKAIAQVDSEYVVLLNSDVEVTEGWLTPLLAYMEAHPEVAAVQPKIRAWRDKERFEHAGAAGGYLDKLGYPYCRGRVLSKTETDHGQYDTVADILWASGACMLIRREVYLKEGGLDARFFAHMEEIDLCWRLNCRGYKIACVPDSVVYHLGGGMLNYENPKKTYLNFRNNLLMIYKNLPSYRLVGAVRLMLDYAAALKYLLTGHPKNAWAVISARWDYHRLKRRYYRPKRKENLAKAVISCPDTVKGYIFFM